MSKIISFIIFFLSINVFTQSKIIGKVYYQSSGWKPVEGIEINSKGSNGDYSNTDGGYSLFFPNHDIGTGVVISIGKNNTSLDISGNEVELVNNKELEQVVTPQNPFNTPINIIVAPKGKRDLAVRKYYNIINSHVENELALKKQELIVIKQKLSISNSIVRKKEAELETYKKINDSLSIYNEAFRIASINKDEATERVKNYIEALESGLSINEARKELNSEKAYKEAVKNIHNLKSTIDEISITAENFKTEFKYEEALNQYNLITAILRLGMFTDRMLIENHLYKAELLSKMKKYEEAVEEYNPVLKIISKYKSNSFKKATILYKIGDAYFRFNNIKKAKEILFEALKEHKKINLKNDNTNILLGKINLSIGLLFYNNDDYETGQNYYDSSLETLIPLFEKYPKIIGSDVTFLYDRIGFYYQTKNELKKAEHYIKLSVKFSKELNSIYNNSFKKSELDSIYSLALFYYVTHQYEKFRLLTASFLPELNEYSLKDPYQYNLLLANIINATVVIKISNFLFNDDLPKTEREQFIILVKYIEKLIDIYSNENLEVIDLKQNADALSYYLKIRNSKKYTSYNNYFSNILIIERDIHSLKEKIKNTNDFNKKQQLFKEISQMCQSVYNKFSDNNDMKKYAILHYADLASFSIENKVYTESIKYVEKIRYLDKTNYFNGLCNLILVNAYILMNKSEKAWIIYKKYKNKPFPNSSSTYNEYFLQDIYYLESIGIHHKDFKKIKTFLRTN